LIDALKTILYGKVTYLERQTTRDNSAHKKANYGYAKNLKQ